MYGASKMFGSFQLALHEGLVDHNFGGASVSSLLCHVSTCFRIGSKFRCMRSTPTEMQSMREKDFECFARTGVNAPGTELPSTKPSEDDH